MPSSTRPGDVLSGRYRLVDLLGESRGGRFFRGHDQVLARQVAVHVISSTDDRAEELTAAARRSVQIQDRRILRVLDTDTRAGVCYVVNEWGQGRSLDLLLADEGALAPRRAAWLVHEVADVLATAHAAGVAHGRLVPENVLIDHHGAVRLIGFAVDAALHGLPAQGRSSDIADLGGLLYAALTGRWAGVSRSSVPEALTEGGRPLRPRQVKAGIPRVLDTLSEEILRGRSARGTTRDVHTAAGIRDALAEFVGDPAGMAEAEAARMRTHVALSGPRPALPDALPHAPDDGDGAPDASPRDRAPEEGQDQDRHQDQSPDQAPDTGEDTGELTQAVPVGDAEDETGAESAGGAVGADGADRSGGADQQDSSEVPTQAGMPVFDDDSSEVHWFSTSRDKPPPPPAFEEPEQKPLFAPEPPQGRPQRTPRPGTAAAAAKPAEEYWPWGDSSATGAGSGTGAVTPYPPEEEAYDEHVPGRRSLRLALVIGIVTLLLLVGAVLWTVLTGRSPLPLGSEDSPSGTDSPTGTAGPLRPVRNLSATDLDPQGDPPEENADLVSRAVDGNPDTAWRTMTYNQNLGPGGLKTGLGLEVDLGEVRAPREVTVTVEGSDPTAFKLFLSGQSVDKVADLTPIAADAGTGEVKVELDGNDRGRYLVVWLTRLPRSGDGYRGEIAEISVRE